MFLPRLLVLVPIAALAGCNVLSRPDATVTEPVLPVAALESEPPVGAGCAPAIARTRAVLDGDIATGNVGTTVGKRFSADLDQAETVCAAGRSGEALRLLSSAKVRYGYR